MDDNTSSEEIEYHNNSTGVIDHTFDGNWINLLNTEEEVDVTSIQYINGTNEIYMNADEKVSIKIMHHFYNQRIMKMYPPDQNIVQRNEEYSVIKIIFLIYYQINQIVFNGSYHFYYLLSMTQNCHHIWIISVNTLTPKIKKFIPMIIWEKLLLTSVIRNAKTTKNTEAISIIFRNCY